MRGSRMGMPGLLIDPGMDLSIDPPPAAVDLILTDWSMTFAGVNGTVNSAAWAPSGQIRFAWRDQSGGSDVVSTWTAAGTSLGAPLTTTGLVVGHHYHAEYQAADDGAVWRAVLYSDESTQLVWTQPAKAAPLNLDLHDI